MPTPTKNSAKHFFLPCQNVLYLIQVWVSEPRHFNKKLKIWFSEYWNMNEFVAIVLFFMGTALSCNTGLTHTAGCIIYCLDIIFWFVRLLDLLAINQQAGPYVNMISNMVHFHFLFIDTVLRDNFHTHQKTKSILFSRNALIRISIQGTLCS